MRTTKQATAQSVTVSRMRCGSMGDCSELSEEEDAEVEEEERAGLCLHKACSTLIDFVWMSDFAGLPW